MISNKEKNFVSAVVYVNNNEKTIEEFLKRINDILEKNFYKYEIVCVNDASGDCSLEKIKNFAKCVKNQNISVINMSYYQGLELSMEAGVDLAIGDFVYEFDNITDDYQDDVIMDVYRKCLNGYDIVSATSNVSGKMVSKLFYSVFNKHSALEYKLQTETFRILSRRAINRVNSINKNTPYRKAVYANCGLKQYNIKYTSNSFNKRKFSRRDYSNRKNVATTSLILFTDLGYKFSLSMALVMLLVTLLVALYTVIIFISNSPIQGWTTTMLFLSFGFFGMFSMLAIIIKYLDVLIDLNFKRKHYLVEGIEKLN